jgi:hypothetical protein
MAKRRLYLTIIKMGASPGTVTTVNSSGAIFIRTYLKNRILVQDCGGAELQTGGILLYVEDLKRGTHPAKGGRPKDIFEMGSK